MKKILLVSLILGLFLNAWLPAKIVRANLIEDMQEFIPDNMPKNWKTGESAQEGFFQIISPIIDVLIYVAGTLAVIGLIIAGAQYIFAFGGKGIESAKKNIIWTLLGLVAVILSYAVVYNVLRLVDKLLTD